MKTKNRVLLFMLSLLMILSNFNIVNAGDTNVGGGGSNTGATGARDGWTYNKTNNEGLRFSVYFAKSIDEMSTGNAIPVGKAVNVSNKGLKYINNANYSTALTIYDYKSKNVNYLPSKSKINCITSSYIAQSLPVLWSGGNNTVSEQYMKNYFESNNYKAISEILREAGTNITVQDFLQGVYKTNSGKTIKGIYKIYYEPLISFNVGNINNTAGQQVVKASGSAVFTLRDILGFRQEIATSLNAQDMIVLRIPQIIIHTANSAFLVKDDKSINMIKKQDNFLIPDANQSGTRNLIKKETQKGGIIENSMGVGVYTPEIKKVPFQFDWIDDDTIKDPNPKFKWEKEKEEGTISPINNKVKSYCIIDKKELENKKDFKEVDFNKCRIKENYTTPKIKITENEDVIVKYEESINKQVDEIDNIVRQEFNRNFKYEQGKGYIGKVDDDYEFVSYQVVKKEDYEPFSDFSTARKIIKQSNNYETVDMQENTYLLVKWKKKEKVNIDEKSYVIPEWRLSKRFFTEKGETEMNLKLKKYKSNLSNVKFETEGTYNYYRVNPNNQYWVNDSVDNLKFKDYLMIKTFTQGDYNISKYDYHKIVDTYNMLNYIKTTTDTNLKLASFVNLNTNMINDSRDYKIDFDYKTDSINADYNKSDDYTAKIYNKDTYYLKWKVRKANGYIENKEIKITPSQADYVRLDRHADTLYKMYQAKNYDKFIMNKQYINNFKKNNNVVKLAFNAQNPNSIRVYPEVAMLFENNKGDSKIAYVLGDKMREINAISYHTVNNFATDFQLLTNGTNAADTRISQNRNFNNNNFNNNAAVHLKGSAITHNVSKKDANQIYLFKSYVLDVDDNVKTLWGNTEDTRLIHANFLKIFGNYRNGRWEMDGKTKLRTSINDINNQNIYKGKLDEKDVKLREVGNTKLIQHKIIVRGGVLVDGGGLPAEVLEKMHLTGDKNNTVFKNFARCEGQTVDEQLFIDKLKAVRFTNDAEVGKGWYNEDTTTLTVNEYITTIAAVDNVSMGDKISMQIKNLQTPIDKQQFFNHIAKGGADFRAEVLQIKENLNPYNYGGNLAKKRAIVITDVDFLRKNGNRGYYGVPDVSIQDRIN